MILLLSHSCYKEVILPEDDFQNGALEVFRMNGNIPFADMERGMMLYFLTENALGSFSPLVEYSDYQSIHWEGREMPSGGVIDLGRVEYGRPYRILADRKGNTQEFELYFTPLPILHLNTEENIPDEPKVLSYMDLQYTTEAIPPDSNLVFSSYAGVELRGRTAMKHPKKAYGLELWSNRYGLDRQAPLLGMRYGEDWFLDAMYIDDLRMRNKLAFEIWEDMAPSPPGDYSESVFPGIHLEYVELFINNSYQGLYCLGERMDENLLQFASRQWEKGGVLYKSVDWADGATLFEWYEPDPPLSLLWDGWEQIYPDKSPAWGALDELRDLTVRGSDEDFIAGIATLVDMENAARYYLFMNFLLAYDNMGKNLFYARYSGNAPLFMIPWDLEASLGRMYDKSNSLTVGVLGNELFYRLLDLEETGFSSLISQLWTELRQGLLSEDALQERIRAHYLLLDQSGAMERENTRWNEQIDLKEEYEYLLQWTTQRLDYLDAELSKD